MHGLINRSIQCFIHDTYGDRVWRSVAEKAGVPDTGFEPMLIYEDQQTLAIVDAATDLLKQASSDFLESLGTYLVAHENTQRVRRLLRFGGETFDEFLLSLDELPGRARMAVPDLEMPELVLHHRGYGLFELHCIWEWAVFGRVVMGMLRGMADDYGALVLLDYEEGVAQRETIAITVAESSFAEGRHFDLANVME